MLAAHTMSKTPSAADRSEDRRIEPTGPDTLVFTQVNGKRVVSRVHPASNPQPLSNMTLLFDVSKAVLFDLKTKNGWPEANYSLSHSSEKKPHALRSAWGFLLLFASALCARPVSSLRRGVQVFVMRRSGLFRASSVTHSVKARSRELRLRRCAYKIDSGVPGVV